MNSKKKRQKLFLEQYREFGTIVRTCKATGVSRTLVYEWKNNDPEFAAALEQAEHDATEELISEARRRAFMGVDEPIYYKGKRVDTIKRYSDPLLMFLIKPKRPEYRDKTITTIETPPGGIDINTYQMTPEERRKRINELIAKRGDGAVSPPGAGTEV